MLYSLFQSDNAENRKQETTRRSPRKSQSLDQEPSLKPVQSAEDDTEMDELVSDSFLRLSPPPSERDYYFHLDENEGLTDLFNFSISSLLADLRSPPFNWLPPCGPAMLANLLLASPKIPLQMASV